MTERSKPARAARTLSKRQTQIVDVAMRIIATHGARHFTVQALASEVGVTGGAIYRHFESMEAIADAIVDRIDQLLFKGFPPDAADPIERLRLFFHHRAETIRSNPHVSRILLSDHLSHACGAEYTERLQEFKRKTQRFILSCLGEAANNGTLSAELAPEVGAVLVMGAIHALSHLSTRLSLDPRPGSLGEQVWSAIERMLRCPSSSTKRDGQATQRVNRKQKSNSRKGTRTCR